ncbi:hypothetical protein NEOLEDRAFT_1134837 [Neolentinus lepideus HHB14362 ss-1]|uniref:Uncharacterized protein n=1 Tax=Neolentinus lepideus HHB14362 ss-1 TaxID=1314782 RepID=A0A165RZF4_9AGAM|nr:hypothetical protein NEOLEDRAFT_1134837 [Neolentinus lepideus HHB14362 ss-1]
MSWGRILAHIALGAAFIAYLVVSSQNLAEEELRNSPALVCENAVYKLDLTDRPHPFLTVSEAYPSLSRYFPGKLYDSLNFFHCFITPAFVAIYRDPLGNVVMDLFNPVFTAIIAWAAVEASTSRSRGGSLAKLVIYLPMVTFALGQVVTIGAISHLLLLPAIIYLRKSTRITKLPSAIQLSAILVQVFLILVSMGIVNGSPESVVLWAIAFLQISPVISHWLYSAPLCNIVGIPFRGLFPKKSPMHGLQTFWQLVTIATSLAHLQAVARIIALALTYDSPTPAIYGLTPAEEWWSSKPTLQVVAIFRYLVSWHTQMELGRALVVYDFMASSLALAALQWEKFTGLGALLYHPIEVLLLGPAGTFAMWQSKVCEQDIAQAERSGQRKAYWKEPRYVQ